MKTKAPLEMRRVVGSVPERVRFAYYGSLKLHQRPGWYEARSESGYRISYGSRPTTAASCR